MNAADPKEIVDSVLDRIETAKEQVIDARANLQITGLVKELDGYIGYHEAMRSLTFAAMTLGMGLEEINEATHARAREILPSEAELEELEKLEAEGE